MASKYMKVEKYYDVGCEECGRHLSTDFHRGFTTSRVRAVSLAISEGFKVIDGRTLCPKCAEKTKH